MKAVALFAETQVELLILGAFVVEESIYWIYRGVRTLFSQPGSACPRVMSSIAESAEFRAGFQRQLLVPDATVPTEFYSIQLRVLNV